MLKIGASVMGIDDLFGQRVFQDRVYREVSSTRRFLDSHLRIALDEKRAMPTTRLALPARQRDIEMGAEFINRERFTDDVHRTKRVQQFPQSLRLDTVNLNVPVLRLLAHQLVAHATADQQRAASFAADGF